MKFTVGTMFVGLILAAAVLPSGDCWAGAGAWEALSPNTNYQAATDGFVVASANVDPGIIGRHDFWMAGYTDSSNPPATRRAFSAYGKGKSSFGLFIGSYTANFTMPVRQGDWWRVDTSGVATTLTVYWLPWTDSIGAMRIPGARGEGQD